MFRLGRIGAKRLMHTSVHSHKNSFARNAAYWATSASVFAIAFAATSSLSASAEQKQATSPGTGPKSIAEESISADVTPLTASDAGLKPEGPYNEETGEINWDCPCLGGMAEGPCGEEFKDAFACFVYSKEEPKGIECVKKFAAMQDCFRLHPEVYADQLDADEKAALAEPTGAGETGEPTAVPAAKVNEAVKDVATSVKDTVKDAAEGAASAVSAVADKVGLNTAEPVTEAQLSNLPDDVVVVVEEDIAPVDGAIIPSGGDSLLGNGDGVITIEQDITPIETLVPVDVVIPVDADLTEEAMGVVDGFESKSEADELRQAAASK